MTEKRLGRILVLFSLGAALAAASAPAAAQYYAGASLGPTTVDLCDARLTGCDDDGRGLKLFAGRAINQNLAVELAWVDLGKLEESAPGGPVSLEIEGIQIAALGSLPLNPNWRAFGKVGLYLWELRARGPGGSFGEDGTNIMFGVGAVWNFSRAIDLRFEWERYDIDGDDIDMLSAGVQLSF